MLFEAEINTRLFRKAIDALLASIDEADLIITSEGISVKAVDAANVSMVMLDLSKTAFTSYKADKKVTIGVDLVRLNGMLKMGDLDSMCHLQLVDDDNLMMRLGNLKYKFWLLSASSIKTPPKIPDISSPSTVILQGSRLMNTVRAMKSVSAEYTTFELKVEPTPLFTMSGGSEKDSVKIELSNDDEWVSIAAIGNQSLSSMFSTSFLDSIGKVLSDIKTVVFEIGDDFPLVIRFKHENMGVKYIIAPSIEAD